MTQREGKQVAMKKLPVIFTEFDRITLRSAALGMHNLVNV